MPLTPNVSVAYSSLLVRAKVTLFCVWDFAVSDRNDSRHLGYCTAVSTAATVALLPSIVLGFNIGSVSGLQFWILETGLWSCSRSVVNRSTAWRTRMVFLLLRIHNSHPVAIPPPHLPRILAMLLRTWRKLQGRRFLRSLWLRNEISKHEIGDRLGDGTPRSRNHQ